MLNNSEQKYYSEAVATMSDFFRSKGFIEVHCQSTLSILSACEDPATVASFHYTGNVWPLKQTNQMELEKILLTSDYEGIFCQTTSYRQEANPIPGRHNLIFPMFEFETRGSFKDLVSLEKDLLKYLLFDEKKFMYCDYLDLAKEFGVKEIGANEEERIHKEKSDVLFLTNFPEYTSPFWNMRRDLPTGLSNKADVILYGIETIGSAEREIDANIMKSRFYSISDGMYAELLYSNFGKDRVEKELNEFLSLDFFPRVGGGIGMTRLIRALKMMES